MPGRTASAGVEGAFGGIRAPCQVKTVVLKGHESLAVRYGRHLQTEEPIERQGLAHVPYADDDTVDPRLDTAPAGRIHASIVDKVPQRFPKWPCPVGIADT